MKKTALLIPFTFLLSACGSFAPAEGTWNLSAPEVTEDTCNFPSDDSEEAESSDSTFTLALTDDGFTFTGDQEGDEAVACTLDGQDFSCEADSETTEEETFSMTIDSTLSGSFASDKEATINIAVDISCEGDDCAAIGEQIGTTFPCGIDATGSATVSE